MLPVPLPLVLELATTLPFLSMSCPCLFHARPVQIQVTDTTLGPNLTIVTSYSALVPSANGTI